MIEIQDSNKPPSIPRIVKGEPLSASKTNKMIDAFNRTFAGVGLPRQVKRASEGSAAAAGISVQQFIITATAANYVIGATWNGVEQGDESIPIAKPWELRPDVFDGGTRDDIAYTFSGDETREADNLVDTETQVVVPSYLAGDVIFAMRNIDGGTGVSITFDDGTSLDVDWLDMNLGARAWAKQSS